MFASCWAYNMWISCLCLASVLLISSLKQACCLILVVEAHESSEDPFHDEEVNRSKAVDTEVNWVWNGRGRGSTQQWHNFCQMCDLFENSILSSFQEFKHSLQVIFLTLKKLNIIVIPVQSLIMVVSLVFFEVHLWLGGQRKGVTKMFG